MNLDGAKEYYPLIIHGYVLSWCFPDFPLFSLIASYNRTKPKHLKCSVQSCMKWRGLEFRRVDQNLDLNRFVVGTDLSAFEPITFPRGRVTNHRVGITYHAIDDVMQGENLDVFVDALLSQREMDAIATLTSAQ